MYLFIRTAPLHIAFPPPQLLPEPKISNHPRLSWTQFKGLQIKWPVGKNAYHFRIHLMRSNLVFRTPRITILNYVQMLLVRRLMMLLQDTLQQNFARSYFIRTFLLIWNDGKKLEPCLTLFAQHFFLLSIPLPKVIAVNEGRKGCRSPIAAQLAWLGVRMNSKTACLVFRDGIHRLHQQYFYFRNVMRFLGTSIHVILSVTRKKIQNFVLCKNFATLPNSSRGLEFHENRK
jgi:hypothetical protein